MSICFRTKARNENKMKRMLNKTTTILMTTILLSLTFLIPVHAIVIQPMVSVAPCDHDWNRVTLVSSNQILTKHLTGYYVAPNVSGGVGVPQSFEASNVSTFSIVPELGELGYSYSFTTSITTKFRIYNGSGVYKQIVGFAYYDRFKVENFYEVNPGSCATIPTVFYQNVYTGTAWGLQ